MHDLLMQTPEFIFRQQSVRLNALYQPFQGADILKPFKHKQSPDQAAWEAMERLQHRGLNEPVPAASTMS
ncbi:MAG: hypothetical protein A2498_06005 [Lentisphaerae bacterium RIFOXYC12_FULL_60_16]|nr:MAG: hypothetical protein A2498_06005 [Lentisphaerae bacterium RIFOXYC12_FULL_60_16]OGV75251.1 MAG: hypothetical protein A2340_00500 [Lentisphaerae bacterium RIFOXYB12_FULL_60_10]